MIHKGSKIRKRQDRRPSKFFYVFLGAVLLMALWFLIDANWRINKKRSEFLVQINQLEKELKELQELKSERELALERAQTDEFREEKLREQGYRKPGEQVFVVVPPEETEEAVVPEKSFWQRLLERLGF